MILKYCLFLTLFRSLFSDVIERNAMDEKSLQTNSSNDAFTLAVERKNQIASVFFMFRHGARTPTRWVSKGYVDKGFLKDGILMPIGGQQLEALGKEAFDKYSFFESKEIVFISSFRERNIHSMTNFTKAFPFQDKRVFYTREESDFLFHSQTFDHNFKKLREEFAEKFKVMIETIFDLAVRHNVTALLDLYTTNYTLKNSYHKLDTLCHLFTTLHCNEVNKIDDNFTLTPVLRKILEYSFSFQMYKINYQKKLLRLRRTNELIILIGKQLLSRVKPYAKYDSVYFQHYSQFSNTIYEVDPAMFISAHDTNLMGMLSVFLDIDVLLNDRFFIPEFAGFISIELIDKNERDFFVEMAHGIEGDKKEPEFEIKMVFENIEIYPKQCGGQKRCLLEEFMQILSDNSKDCHAHDCIKDIEAEELLNQNTHKLI